MQVKSESEVAQSCPTLSDLMNCSLPGSSIHGIFQARVLKWAAITFSLCVLDNLGFHGGSDGKESACNAGDLDLIPELGRSPGEGNGYPLQFSCLENPTNRGAWRATVHGVAELDMTG